MYKKSKKWNSTDDTEGVISLAEHLSLLKKKTKGINPYYFSEQFDLELQKTCLESEYVWSDI